MVNGKESSQLLDALLFTKIFQSFRMAIQPTKLIITFLAIAIICLVGWIMDFSKTVVATPGTQKRLTELNIYVTNPKQVESYIEGLKQENQGVGVFSTLWHFGSGKFHNALKELFELNFASMAKNIADFFSAIGWALRYHTVYCIIFFVITFAVISVSGGAICRITALQFSQGEKPGLTEALRFSTKRFTSFFSTPFAPIGIIIFIGLFIFLLGLMGNIPRAGELIVGIGMPLALIAGALIAVILIGAAAGFNLMFPAVAYDGSDCFDAISRSFSYVYARPWRMVFYTLIAAVYGAICYTFVRFFTFILLWTTRWFLDIGIWVDNSTKETDKLTAIWPEPEFMNLLGSQSIKSNWSETTGAFLVFIFLLVIVGLLVSFIISFYFSTNTIIYSLMRKKVDNTALEDIYTQLDEAEIEPTTTESQPEQTSSQPESESQPESSSPEGQ
jgi:hypothetical protein